MPSSLKMSKNMKSTTIHLNLSYISVYIYIYITYIKIYI